MHFSRVAVRSRSCSCLQLFRLPGAAAALHVFGTFSHFAASLPAASRWQLSNSLLCKVYNLVYSEMMPRLAQAAYLSLTLDGWSRTQVLYYTPPGA
jgi:hypothetical protein